ncbi:MAG: Cellulose synthase catalytic subunit [UDP-forming] [Candidatus Anoxychlamydiales bacterium]|nr:Cellulose synthase catalytic subunit [UDP-forming] [Candidatus Anoxychlamydiales bacterium]
MLKKFGKHFIIIMLCSVIVVMVLYLSVRLFLMITASYFWYDKVLGSLLLIAEFFIITQGMGYLNEVIRVFLKYDKPEEDRPDVPELKTKPYVAILIPSYHEPLSVIEETLVGSYNLYYKNKHIILLDDTRYDLKVKDKNILKYKQDIEELCQKYNINLFRHKWHGAKAGIINDYIKFAQNEKSNDFFFKSYEKTPYYRKRVLSKPKYIAILDADQNPFPEFLDPLVAISENNDKIAFIQTPQYYTNFEKNRIAHAAALQQIIFYEYICVGKGIEDVIFCCGSNVLIRTDALIDIGGFDESSITEDSASSIYFHMKGWKTKYYNKVGVFGKGPEDLGNYFKQQYRWAAGSIDSFRNIIKNMFLHPRKLSLIQWWEYIMSTSFYFSGLIYVILWICPVLYLLFGVPTFFASPIIYGIVFFPYLALSMATFYWTLKKRHYRTIDLLKGQALLLLTFPIFIKAAIFGFFGIRKKFEVTRKKGVSEYPFSKLIPQMLLAVIFFVAVIWGVNRLFYEKELFFAILLNTVWTLFNFFIMMSVFYFNVPKKVMEKTNLVGLK